MAKPVRVIAVRPDSGSELPVVAPATLNDTHDASLTGLLLTSKSYPNNTLIQISSFICACMYCMTAGIIASHANDHLPAVAAGKARDAMDRA